MIINVNADEIFISSNGIFLFHFFLLTSLEICVNQSIAGNIQNKVFRCNKLQDGKDNYQEKIFISTKGFSGFF